MPFTFQVATFMAALDSRKKLAWTRLQSQRLSGGQLSTPEAVVGWLGAVQAQEYPYSKWGLALRMRGATDAALERAFADGAILRTHVMRPTWHFVTPADIRWLLELTASRVRAVLAGYDRKLGIDAAAIKRANLTITEALRGGRQLTRAELKAVLTESGVNVDGTQRLGRVLMHAELDGVICSGARRGKQFTYALLEERVAATRQVGREEALAELARRYFTSHGPAQVQDFAWWSGLASRDVRAGLEMAREHLAEEVLEGKRYWRAASLEAVRRPRRGAYLLGPYDEYLIAYKDRSAAFATQVSTPAAGRGPFAAPVVVDGEVVGGWRRSGDEASISITLDLPGRLGRDDRQLVRDAAERYGAFLGASPRFRL